MPAIPGRHVSNVLTKVATPTRITHIGRGLVMTSPTIRLDQEDDPYP